MKYGVALSANEHSVIREKVRKMKGIRSFLLAILILYGCTAESDTQTPNTISGVPAENEIVMTEGMQITATTLGGMIKANIGGTLKDLHAWEGGTITITAGKGLKRSYTWEGATRSVVMRPRGERWYGSMGIYYPGPGKHWKEHNEISRGVFQEGQQHFDTTQEALEWLKMPNQHNCVYNNDGLVVCYSKTLQRRQLNVDVWQIFVGGKIISKYQEIDRVKENERRHYERFPGTRLDAPGNTRLKKICHVGGEKPKSLPGSQDYKIKVEFPH
ncbi:MAG: hypothetical protein KKC46_08440 [Proteobacteria bacterium]|nr:hypothetical protein [Pseudomonadota bacterium]